MILRVAAVTSCDDFNDSTADGMLRENGKAVPVVVEMRLEGKRL